MISESGDQIVFAQQAAGTPSLGTTCQLQSSVPGPDSPMADLNSTLESSVLPTEETSTTTSACQATVAAALSVATTSSSACETMMWEGWLTSPHPGCTASIDEASTSNALHPASGSIATFQHQSDMLSSMLSSFHPLSVQSSDDCNTTGGGAFLHETAPLDFGGASSKSFTYLSGVPCPLRKRDADQSLSSFSYSKPVSSLWPDSPSPSRPGEFIKSWDNSNPVHVPWPTATTTTIQLLHEAEMETLDQSAHIRNMNYASKSKLELFGNSGAPGCETNHLVSSPSSLLSMPPSAVWTSETSYAPGSFAMSEPPATSRSQQFLDFVRSAQDQTAAMGLESSTIPVDHANSNDPPRRIGKHRCDDLVSSGSASKRQHLVDDHGTARGAVLRFGGGLYASSSGGSGGGGAPSVSQAMELFAIGPALNTNGKPRARRGSATDPQSVYARHRREKINERLKTLQHLVPNGAKVDIVTMLDEAVHYVKFLQLQVKLLKSEKYWIHATPNTYKGIDLTNPPT